MARCGDGSGSDPLRGLTDLTNFGEKVDRHDATVREIKPSNNLQVDPPKRQVY